MARREEAEGFEKTEYEGVDGEDSESNYATLSAVHQVAQFLAREIPSCGILVKTEGDLLRIAYTSYERRPQNGMRDLMDAGKKAIDEFVRVLKKRVREQTGKAFAPKEDRSLSDYSLDKASLNDRYLFKFWRAFRIGE